MKLAQQNKELPIIYGIFDKPNMYGLQAYTIDGQTGEVIDQHFCSSENFAKSDLGFTDPYLLQWDSFNQIEHSTVSFNTERKKKYLQRFPNGYRMEWIGYWKNNEKIVQLTKKNKLFFF